MMLVVVVVVILTLQAMMNDRWGRSHVIHQKFDAVLVPTGSLLQGWRLSDSQNHERWHLYTQQVWDREASPPRSLWAQKLAHRAQAFTHRCLCTMNLLHQEAFTHRHLHTEKVFTEKILHISLYTEKFLHTEAFSQRDLYTEQVLHTEAFNHRIIYQQTPSREETLHREAFSYRCLDSEKLLHKADLTQKLFHTDTFTRKSFYTECAYPTGPTGAFTQRCCCTKKPLLIDGFT